MNEINSMDESQILDVVQIGYGPVGQANAAMLGRLGHTVAVFEKHAQLFGLSRAGHLDHEIMRILQSLDCTSSMEQESVTPDTYEWRNGDGQTLMKFPWGSGISGWRAAYLFYQPVLETALDGLVRSMSNVEVNQGWEAVDVIQFPDHVAVTLRRVRSNANGGDADQRIVRAKYLIAADGGNSFVRRFLGLEMRDLGYRQGFLVLDFLNKSDVHFEFQNTQICDPKRPASIFEMGKHHRRFSFAPLPGETKEDMLNPELAWELVKPWITPDDSELIRQAYYVLEAKVLDQLRHERVLFVGDSAHVMPPFLGQGMCSGIRDAKNLTWKLDLVLRGLADESLLNSYTPERQPHSERYAELSVALARILCMTDVEEARIRDSEIMGGKVPVLKPFPWMWHGILQVSPPPQVERVLGRLGPQGAIQFQGQSGKGDDVIGSGWQVISRKDLTARLDAQSNNLMRSLSIQKLHFGEGGAGDLSGAYTRYLEENDLEAIVVRPDFYVFGGIVAGGDINVVLHGLKEQLRLLD